MWAEAEQFFATELNLASPASKPVTVELFKRMSELIILTASRTLQGKEVRQGLNSRFAQLFHDLDGGFIPINFMFTNLPLPANVKRDRAQRKCRISTGPLSKSAERAKRRRMNTI